VRLFGRVRALGAALPGADLWAIRADPERASESSASAQAGAEGAYALNLPGPGRYLLTIHGGEEDSLSWCLDVDVPAVEALELDLAIPVGRISGRVTDGHGRALPGILVASEPEQHEGAEHGSGEALTDEEGRYELLVPAGRHAVRAGGPSHWWPLEASQGWAEARVGGLVLAENGHLRGIDLVLAQGGVLEGLVSLAGGSPASFARLWSVSGDTFTELGWCDERGRFRLEGVAVGSHLVRASGRASTTSDPVRVEVVAGETRRLELALVPATLVRLRVRENGAPVGSEILLRDERGQAQPVERGESGAAWLGPLIPGRYTVQARRDGKVAERAFDVTGDQEEAELELVFE